MSRIVHHGLWTAAIVLISTRAAVMGQSCIPPNIIPGQPVNVTTCPGQIASFSVNATGTNLMYQWQLSTNGGGLYNPIPGANASVYNRTVVNDDNGYRFRCMVFNGCGSATSNSALLSIPVIYVNQLAVGANNGTSWFNAFVTLDLALVAAATNGKPCNQIWVARGTYFPTMPSDPLDQRSATFSLINHTAVYGGFFGNEARLNQRNPAANLTVLTNNPSNSRYVVTAKGTDSTLLDGFTITAAAHQPPECAAEFYINGGIAAGQDRFSTLQVITERDRYLDLDPDPTVPITARPTLSNNHQHVSVDQFLPPAQGSLLEVASPDHECAGSCPPGAYHLDAALNPAGYADAMALDELNILTGARASLTNRAGFTYGAPEAMYVRTLRLYPSSVLNTNNQRIYYDQLVDENNAPINPVGVNPNGSRVINLPLTGYSLGVIDMNDPAEFDCRVRTRIRDDPLNPSSPAGSIQRIDVPLPPGPNEGVMDMQTLAAQSVSAKGAFARSGTDAITVTFEYRFLSAPPGTRLAVKLGSSFTPDDPDDVIVAHVDPPLSGPGSVGSNQFAFFRGTYLVPTLNLHRGTYLEIELLANGAAPVKSSAASLSGGMSPSSPAGSPEAQINYMALDTCLVCGDLNGSGDVTELDYLRLLAAYGQAATPGSAAGTCMDLTTDNYVDLGDLMIMDLALQDPSDWGNLCPATSEATSFAHLSDGISQQSLTSSGALHVAGKEAGADQNDYLYSVVASQVSVSGDGVTTIGSSVCPSGDPPALPNAGVDPSRGNGPLVRANNGDLYQVHPVEGLYKLAADGSRPLALQAGTASMPGGGTLRVGVSFSGGRTGAPISDAKVRVSGSSTYVWVVPVTVTPATGNAYRAAAKVQLTSNGGWSLVHVYGQADGPQNLREIEVSGGLVLVSGSGGVGDDRVVLYDEEGSSSAARSSVLLASLFSSTSDIPVNPAGMLLADDSVYMAAACVATAGTAQRIYRFKLTASPTLCDITLVPDGQVTIAPPTFNDPMLTNFLTLARHPSSHDIWAMGFAMPTFTDSAPTGPGLFTTPLLAVVSPAWFTSPPANLTAATLSCNALAMPTSIVFHDGAAPTIRAWRSVRSHAGTCALPIALNGAATGNASSGPTVESRSGGIQRIEIDFDQPVSLTNSSAISVTGRRTIGGVLQSPASYTPGSASMVDADTLALTFAADALPDEACYTIDLAGTVQNAPGQALTGDTDCQIRSLYGDVTGNGELKLSDAVQIKSKAAGQSAATEPRFDIDVSGSIDVQDAVTIKWRVISPPRQALCP